MKYSLMSLMIDEKLRLTKPNFIHLAMAEQMGYTGDKESLEDVFAFLNQKGIPIQNGTMEFEDYVRFAKENGFDGIDMMSFHFEEDGKKAAKILEKYGVVLSAVNSIIPFVNAKTEEDFERCFREAKDIIDRAGDAGCRNILMMPSVYRAEAGITREQAFQNMAAGLRACVSYGAKKGITVNTETLESIGVPLCSLGEMFRMFEEVPGLKYSHDTGNPLVANEDPMTAYSRLKDKVVAIHFKDLAYTEEQTEMMTPDGRYLRRADFGTGVVDFEEHMKALKADGYQGYITLEGKLPAKDQLESTVKTLEFFRKMERRISC